MSPEDLRQMSAHAPKGNDPAREFSFLVEERENGIRADKVLSARLVKLSRSRLQKLFLEGMVWCNDEAIRKSRKLHCGDFVSVIIGPPKPLSLRPVAIPLEILFEDGDMVAVAKPSGMVVHPGSGTGDDTLVHALLHHCSGELSGIGGIERPGIVHRLDRETSGVIVAGKTDAGFRGLAEQFSGRKLMKTYLALVKGVPGLLAGRIEEPIGRHATARHRMTVRSDGRDAVSEWERIEDFGTVSSLLRVQILTGRTHQIRVHFSHLGHPLLGDLVYGYRAGKAPLPKLPRVMLHAFELELNHPVSGERMKLQAPLPADFTEVLRELREQFGGSSESQVVG
jgi:23S rRNA pseudouridine1911/1915/1917 synthase